MANYTQTTFFAPKDLLSTGNPDKIILGAEIDPEFAAISAAIATKYDAANLATQGDAELGTSNDTLMTPLRVEQWASVNAGIVSQLRSLADPDADRILFWDDSGNTTSFLEVGSGLSISSTTLGIEESQINHNLLLSYDANEHIDHTAVSITAGVGLSGGGTLAATRTLDVDIPGTTLMPNTIDANNDTLLMYDTSAGTHFRVPIGDVTSSDSGFVPVSRQINGGSGLSGGGDLSANRTLSLDTGSSRNVDHAAVSITAGLGLVGGGTLAATRTLDVGAGSGISVAADAVSLDTGSARNTDHTSVSISAGEGLSGGGNISATRTLSLSIDSLTQVFPAEDDEIGVYDSSATAHRKVDVQDLRGQFKYLTADRAYTSATSTLTDITDFTGFNIEAGRYFIELYLSSYVNSTVSGIVLGLQYNTTTFSGGWWGSDSDSLDNRDTADNTINLEYGSLGTTWGPRSYYGTLDLTGSAGTLDVQIRHLGGAGILTIEEGSFIRLTRLA